MTFIDDSPVPVANRALSNRHSKTVSPCTEWFGCSQKRLLLPLVVAAVTFASAACSNRALYEMIQQNRLQACEELPIPQQAQCKSQHQTSYEDYRRERNK